MNLWCSDCCIPDEFTENQVTWFVADNSSLYKKQASQQVGSSPATYTRITTNRAYQSNITQQRVKASERATTVGSPRAFTRDYMMLTMAPATQNPRVNIALPMSGMQKQDTIKILQSQNMQYLKIIANELAPLKRDYQYLKRAYHQKLQLVKYMSLRLEEIQRLHYQNGKDSTNSVLTKI